MSAPSGNPIYQFLGPYGDVVLIEDTQEDRELDEVETVIQLCVNSLDYHFHDEADLTNLLSKMGFVPVEPIEVQVGW